MGSKKRICHLWLELMTIIYGCLHFSGKKDYFNGKILTRSILNPFLYTGNKA
jgi:hypothetical protein